MKMRGLAVHLVLLAGAAGAATYVWTRDQKAVAAVAAGDVIVWQGKVDDVQRIAFEGKARKVTLEARNDEAGRWYAGEAVTTTAVDGGASSSKSTSFVSVAAADKIATAIAPLHSSRDLGKLEGERSVEFGLDDPEGTITATIGGVPHKALLGATAPGGQERYVRDGDTGEVYVVRSDVVRDLVAGESALTERDPHGFKEAAVDEARIGAGDKKRTVVHKGPDNKRIWTDPKDPDKADETVGNWLGKLDRLRPTEYLATLPGGAQPVVRVDFSVPSVKGAFVELEKVFPSTPEGKPDYYIRTERTRQWAKVAPSLGEQVDQDVGSILR